jgi:ribonuclease HI
VTKKSKFYVVWRGVKPGIYTDWAVCAKMFSGAAYKSFDTKEQAEAAYVAGPKSAAAKVQSATSKASKGFEKRKMPGTKEPIAKKPIAQSISVDAAWNTFTGDMEYQGVQTETKSPLFHVGPLADGTNNVGEYLAIVHGLAFLKKKGDPRPIYSDSVNAIGWVKAKKHRSKLEATERNKAIFDLLERANQWLADNDYPNPILKWETKTWGENPADFGRK